MNWQKGKTGKEYPCQKKDKRLLVLFAFATLVLLSGLNLAQTGDLPTFINNTWIEIHGEKNEVYRIHGSQDVSVIDVKQFAQMIGIGKVSLLSSGSYVNFPYETGRAYTLSEEGTVIASVSPKLAFFLGRQFSVNVAAVEDLTLIHGVGPVLAEKIVTYRQNHGPIQNGQQLRQVKGIGHSTQNKLERHLTYSLAND